VLHIPFFAEEVMPWKECSVMGERLQFVARGRADGGTLQGKHLYPWARSPMSFGSPITRAISCGQLSILHQALLMTYSFKQIVHLNGVTATRRAAIPNGIGQHCYRLGSSAKA